jgi:hypothetical protein
MNDKAQQPRDGSASQAAREGASRDDDARPKADPVLIRRHELLEEALNGPRRPRRRGPLNWSGDNDTTVAFQSIEQALADAVPVDRPTSDLPQKSEQKKQAGS